MYTHLQFPKETLFPLAGVVVDGNGLEKQTSFSGETLEIQRG